MTDAERKEALKQRVALIDGVCKAFRKHSGKHLDVYEKILEHVLAKRETEKGGK